ncbi:MAG: hypothetical protein KY475_02615 [Planctomycetes bacterium]|nr:hypothetical protein [Planctomycetota bacterium]
MFSAKSCLAILLMTLPLCLCGSDVAPAGRMEGFETPEPSWRLAGNDCGAQLLLRERTFQPENVRSGAGAEHLRIMAGQGTYVHVMQDVGRARIIPELRPSLWIKSDRTGLQLRGRVVLPRSRDPHTGGPATLWVEGEAYAQPGAWRQLRIHGVALQVQRQARVMRAQQNNPDVDEREAYLDLIVLNAYGGPGVTDVWIDDLDMEGYSEAGAAPLAAETAESERWEDDDGPLFAAAPGGDRPPHLEGTTMVAGRGPLAVRMIEHRGESLDYLKSLGFNAVRLTNPATPQQLEEARRLDLWLVAPPPHATGQADITAAHDRVLAWDLGSELAQRDLERVRRLAQAVRDADPRRGRPVLAAPRENVWAYRRMSDVLLLGDAPLGTARSITDYRDRLIEQVGQGPRRTPVWAMIQTEARPEIVELMASLAGGPLPIAVEAAQIRLLTLAAVEAGATGLYFRSRGPLDASDPATQLRGAALNMVNRELSLIEPWIAGPSRLDTLETGAAGVRATVLSTERSKLILVAQHHPDEQFAAAPSSPQTIPLLISGAPASWKAYQIGGDRLIPLAVQQVGGGMRIALSGVGRWAMVVVTDDALTVNFLSRRQRQCVQPLAKLHHEVLSREAAAVEEALTQAPADLPARYDAAERLAPARAALGQCQALLDASDPAGSLMMAERAEQSLIHLRRLMWSNAAEGFSSRTASPFCSSFAALPLHWRLTQQLGAVAWGPNSLAGGDFESVEHLGASGWTQKRGGEDAFHVQVELSPDRPQQGRYALHLRAAKIAGSAPFDDAPLRVTSAVAPTPPGLLVRIRGWVRVVTAEAGGPAVLKVFDTVGGEATGETFRPTGDWRPFTLYRVAPPGANMKIAFEMLTAGEAWIDGVSVEGASISPAPVAPAEARLAPTRSR